MMANPSGSGIPGLPTASTTASTLNYLLRPPQNGLAMSLGLPLQLNGSHHGRPGSGERIPIAAIGHTGRRVEPSAQKESMNCKSCRKKKIKCNRMKPSCGACLAFQCPCIYDAIPKKRGPKTEVLEELLKRVSGLEKRLLEEQEASQLTKKITYNNELQASSSSSISSSALSVPNSTQQGQSGIAGVHGGGAASAEEGACKQNKLRQQNQQAYEAEMGAGSIGMCHSASESISNNSGTRVGVLQENSRPDLDHSHISPGSAVDGSLSYVLEGRKSTGIDQHYSYDMESPPHTSSSPGATVANDSVTTPPDFTMSTAVPQQQLQKGRSEEDDQRPPLKRRRTSDPPAVMPRVLAPTLLISTLPVQSAPQTPRNQTLSAEHGATSAPVVPQTGSPPRHGLAFPDCYIDAFFRDFHAKPYEILHEESFRRNLLKGIVHPSQLHVVCALGAKVLNSSESWEVGRNSHRLDGNHSNGHRLCVQYTEAARAAIDPDIPSLETFQTLLLLTAAYYCIGRGYKTYMLLGTAVRMAYGLDLNRELPESALVTPVEREVRRRAFWACFLLDRFTVCGSRRPPMIQEESILLKLPSSMPQLGAWDEEDYTMPTGDNRPGQHVPVGGVDISHWTHGACASALFIDITKVMGTTVRYIEQGGVKGDSHFPWHPKSNLSKIRYELQTWSDRTNRLFAPSFGGQGEGLYLRHPHVTVLVAAKAVFHLVNCLIYRPFLPLEFPGVASVENTRGGERGAAGGMSPDDVVNGPCGNGKQTGQQFNIWQVEASKQCFLHANAIWDLIELVVKKKKPECFQWTSVLGYCLMTAATIHVHGVYYKGTQPGDLFNTSQIYLQREVEQLHDLCSNWPAVQLQYVVIKHLVKAHQELVQRLQLVGDDNKGSTTGIYGGACSQDAPGSNIQYSVGGQMIPVDDFFDRYPNKEQYFDVAHVPFVDDMVEMATKLSLEDTQDSTTEVLLLTPVGTPVQSAIYPGNGNGAVAHLDHEDSQQCHTHYDKAVLIDAPTPDGGKFQALNLLHQIDSASTTSPITGVYEYLTPVSGRSPSPIHMSGLLQFTPDIPRSIPTTTRTFDTVMGAHYPSGFPRFAPQNSPTLRPRNKKQHPDENLQVNMNYNSCEGSPAPTYSTPSASQQQLNQFYAPSQFPTPYRLEPLTPVDSVPVGMNNQRGGYMEEVIHATVNSPTSRCAGSHYTVQADFYGPRTNVGPPVMHTAQQMGSAGLGHVPWEGEEPDPFLTLLDRMAVEDRSDYGDLHPRVRPHLNDSVPTQVVLKQEYEAPSMNPGMLPSGPMHIGVPPQEHISKSMNLEARGPLDSVQGSPTPAMRMDSVHMGAIGMTGYHDSCQWVPTHQGPIQGLGPGSSHGVNY